MLSNISLMSEPLGLPDELLDVIVNKYNSPAVRPEYQYLRDVISKF